MVLSDGSLKCVFSSISGSAVVSPLSADVVEPDHRNNSLRYAFHSREEWTAIAKACRVRSGLTSFCSSPVSTESAARLVMKMRRASMRSPDGFAEFVRARSPALLRTAWLLTGDVGRAEDLLQTVLARAWRNWRRVARDGNPEAYVRRMLYTTYLSWWQRRWRGEVPTETLPDSAGSESMAADSAVRITVRGALARLSGRQRAVLVLRFFEDLSVAETAALLGCTAGTVKTQTSRALAALRLDGDVRSLFSGEVGP